MKHVLHFNRSSMYTRVFAYAVLACILPTSFAQWDVLPDKEQPSTPASHSYTNSSLDSSDRTRLHLCDCEPATGSPGDLSCDKEGFFITSFENQGQWVSGGGSVPLSKANCCRPCLPDRLPDTSANDDTSKAIAVVSYGCHSSSSAIPVLCEDEGSSFVSGFTDAVRVFTKTDTYYPINNVQCCTPSLLLENGDAWELERCDCHDAEDADYPVNCGDDEVLTGFTHYRITPLAQIVPIGPARCCGVCLSSSSIHPARDCADLNHCSGNGICSLGRCECLRGWAGSDCSSTTGNNHWTGNVPPWAVVLIVIGSCLLASVILIGGVNFIEWVQEHAQRARDRADAGGDDDEGAGEALLLRIDADDTGSVGSEDTDYGDDNDLDQEVEERIEGVIHDLSTQDGDNGEVEAAAEPDVEQGLTNTATNSNSTTSDSGDAEQTTADHNEEIIVAATAAPTTAVDAAINNNNTSTITEEDEQQAREKDAAAALRLGGYDGVGPLCSVDCSVCMIRPVQTVVVPCGHICMCRRCSRRLQRCPICRKSIARRQRLYV